MSRKKARAYGIAISEDFNRVDQDIEDEILETYTKATEESQDLFLSQLPEFLLLLQVPICFSKDITECVDYYYEYMHKQIGENRFREANYKQSLTLQLVLAFTISSYADGSSDTSILDIVDIDKLIKQCNKLMKFRNTYSHIYASWKLFVDAATTRDNNESTIINYHLTLPNLKKIKSILKLDEFNGLSLGDSFLIDMLSCCKTAPNGDTINYDLNKPKQGSYVTIKDFAEILGNLGELD